MAQTHRLQMKAIECLHLARTVPKLGPEWYDRWNRICGKYSERAVIAKLEELATRGYVEYAITAHGAWLTNKGRAALDEIETPQA